jgi:hypothetical protein
VEPARRLLRLRRDGVAEEGERPRDLGRAPERRDGVRRRLEQFADRLRVQDLVFDGVAFRHE